MKTKFMGIMLILAFALNLSACGNSQENMKSSENGIFIDVPQSEKDNTSEKTGSESSDNNTKVGTVNDSAFSGKVSGCYYADGNRIIVAADKLYLYDTGKSETIASADIFLNELCVQPYSDGYFIVGEENNSGSTGSFATAQSSNGVKGYLLNKDFVVENTISFRGLLNDDSVLQMASVAISQDGKQIAFGGLQGLYLYDTSSQKVHTILNYSENGRANNMEIVTIDSLTFTGDKTLTYVGMGISSNGGDGVSVYGTVSTDNANLIITQKADYEVDVEEVQKGGNLLVMPQSFNKNNGTLLMLDTASNTEKRLHSQVAAKEKTGFSALSKGNMLLLPF